jgi:hypothetical protein
VMHLNTRACEVAAFLPFTTCLGCSIAQLLPSLDSAVVAEW